MTIAESIARGGPTLTTFPIHHSAAEGFAKQAEAYQRGRPDYPAGVQMWLQRHVGLSPDKQVADLGAGTGKFTRLLAATGATVTAVEPVAEMRAQLVAALPTVTAVAGSAEALPVADASLDAVFCAQSFHWFATPAVLAEIRRVLRPGGVLGLVWNVRDERVDWVAEIERLVRPHGADVPSFEKGDWRRVFPADGFDALDEACFPYQHVGPVGQVIIDRYRSVSFVAALPAPEQEALLASLRRLVAAHPALSGREIITFPYRTFAYSTRRVG
jgi:SAM-dependent methyltransferase